jgi:hypothetical protein
MAHYLQEAYDESLHLGLHIANVVPSIWYYKNIDLGDQLLQMSIKDISSNGALWF